MRVNARLDAESELKLEYLLEATGLGISDVLKASIEHYYSSVRSERPPRLKHVSAYIGAQGSGRHDVAERAKDLLTDAFGTKR
jgi:hypothetical protein